MEILEEGKISITVNKITVDISVFSMIDYISWYLANYGQDYIFDKVIDEMKKYYKLHKQKKEMNLNGQA